MGIEHPDVATSYNNIGIVWENMDAYDKALGFYENFLAINIKNHGEDRPHTAYALWTIRLCLQKMEDYTSAIKVFNNGFKIQCKGSYPFKIASCFEKLVNNQEALDYFIQSAEN